MEIREDRWLSSIFGHSVFKIEVESSDVARENNAASVCNQISRHASQQSAALYYAKVDTNQVAVVRLLSTAGLYAVDLNVTFGIDTGSSPCPPEVSRGSIGEVRPEQHQSVLDIAGSCFQYSRFHLDPYVPVTIANRIKHDWILNYIQKKRGEKLFAANIDEQPVGFLAVLASESDGRRIRTIDLIGVNRAFQNQGVGKALVTFFINQYKGQSDYLQVSTQAANLPSMQLYQKLGFFIVKTQYVMHMHVR